MKIINETALMKNQKASTVILPDVQFEAVQTAAGSSLVFSLNENGILNCTCEVPGDIHGWTVNALSVARATADFPNQTVQVTHFDIGQDPVSNAIDLVMVLNVNNQDHLYVSLGNASDTWMNYAPTWSYVKFDDPNYPAYATASINNVYLSRYAGNQYAFVDLITDPVTKALTRYAVDYTGQTWQEIANTATPQCWMPHNFPMTVQAGTLTSTIGCGPGDVGVNGVYTLGVNNSNANTAALVYSPLFNANDPTGPGYPTNFDLSKLSLDVTRMAMAVSARSDGNTDLFFASNGTLYFVPNEQQVEVNGVLPVPTAIYTHNLLQKITELHVNTWNDNNNDNPNGNIVLWGKSDDPDNPGSSQLFIMECAVGHEQEGAATNVNSTSWSCPIPILSGVVNAATYINGNYSALNTIDPVNGNAYGSCSVLFANQVSGTVDAPTCTMTQLFQNPVTTAWQERNMLTDAGNDYSIMYETSTYTTHINISDDNNVPQANVAVAIWASSPCSVYVNNVYTTLDNTNVCKTTSDGLGIINITQPVDSIGGISYFVSVQDPVTQEIYSEAINPVSGTVTQLNTNVPDGSNDHLSGVMVQDELGNSTPLVSDSTITSTQTTSSSQNIYSICQQNGNVNPDGLVTGQSWPTPTAADFTTTTSLSAVATKPIGIKAVADPLAKHIRFNPATDKIWGSTFGQNATHFEGIDAIKEMGVSLNTDGSLSFAAQDNAPGSLANPIETKAGHIFKWMKTEAEKLEKVAITFTGGVIHCVVMIAGEAYHFLVKCASDIANAAHTFLNAVKTAFEDVVKWLGSIFDWNDIIRTHKVIKAMFTTYANHCIYNIGNAQAQLNYAAGEAITAINQWADLPSDTFAQDTYPSQNATAPQNQGQHSPTANWGHHQANHNAANSGCQGLDAEVGELLNDFFTAMEVEADIISQAIDQLKGIISQAGSMPLDTLIRQIVAVIGEAVINSTVNVADTLLTVAEQIVGDVVSTTLAAPMHIPVLSPLYKTFSGGDELSILDMICLVVAIPTNVVYKLANHMQAPFADNDNSTALINATTFNEFMQAAANVPLTTAPAAAAQSLDDSEVWTDAQNKFWMFIANSCALGGSILVSAMGLLKIKYPNGYGVATAYAISYLPYIAPDIIGVVQNFYYPKTNWYNYMNLGLGTLGLVKAFVDIKLAKSLGSGPVVPPANVPVVDPAAPAEIPPVNNVPVPALAADTGATSGWKKPFANGKSWNDASPFVESAINLLWEVPVAFAYIDAKNQPGFDYKANVLTCTGNTMFNFGGLISPFATFGPPPANLIIAVTQTVMNLGYGAMSFASWYE